MRTFACLLGMFAVAGCSSHLLDVGDAGSGGAADLGPAGPMRFAVFGDARPSKPNATSGYPTDVLTHIFDLMEQRGLPFAVGTGDYMFASTEANVSAQVDLLAMAESGYHGAVYHGMGNHECTGATASNCPAGNETPNVRAFMSNLIPKGTTTPYYRVDVDTPKGKAKFLFVAANAWSDAQAAWLTQQVADPTTYTFAVRHEPPSVTDPPGTAPSEQILLSAPLTLELLGHWHSYERLDNRHVVSGNAGAPLGNYNAFGFVLVEQLDDGNLAVSEIEESTGMPTDAWRITPTGEAAP